MITTTKRTRDLKRIAGHVRKNGWPDGYDYAIIGLSGVVFSNLPSFLGHDVIGYYKKETVIEFMKFQEENFSS